MLRAQTPIAWLIGSWPESPMGVAGRNAEFPQPVQHSDMVSVQVFTDSCQRPTQAVKVDGVVDLL